MRNAQCKGFSILQFSNYQCARLDRASATRPPRVFVRQSQGTCFSLKGLSRIVVYWEELPAVAECVAPTWLTYSILSRQITFVDRDQWPLRHYPIHHAAVSLTGLLFLRRTSKSLLDKEHRIMNHPPFFNLPLPPRSAVSFAM